MLRQKLQQQTLKKKAWLKNPALLVLVPVRLVQAALQAANLAVQKAAKAKLALRKKQNSNCKR